MVRPVGSFTARTESVVPPYKTESALPLPSMLAVRRPCRSNVSLPTPPRGESSQPVATFLSTDVAPIGGR